MTPPYPLPENESRVLPCPRCQVKNRVLLHRAFVQPEGLRCGSCQASLLCARDAPLRLGEIDYQHPLDRQSLTALEAVPGVTMLVKKLVEVTLERYDRLFNQSSFLRVSPLQLPTLHRLFERAASRLGVAELPELYLFEGQSINAYTSGVDRPYVAVSSALCDACDDDEVTCVLAHELAHWQSKHVLYKTAARLLSVAAGELLRTTLGLGNLLIVPLQLALLKWDRCSELTADRGMLLAARDPQLALRVLMKLVGFSGRLREELSLEAFMAQAQKARAAPEEGVLDRFYTLLQTASRTHPFPLWRAAELYSWACEGEYLSVLQRFA